MKMKKKTDILLLGGQEPMARRLDDNSNIFKGIPPYFTPYGKDFIKTARRAYSFPAYALPILAVSVGRAGASVSCINDLYAEPPEAVEKAVAGARLAVGISTTFMTSKGSIAKAVRLVRKTNPSAKVILGGPGIINFPAVRKLADINVLYEGEETMAELADAIRRRRDLSAIRGISFMRSGKETLSAAREPVRDLGATGVPRWKLLAKKVREERYLPIESSRGCVGKCSFCLETRYWPGVRFYPVERVIRELRKNIADFGIRHYYFQDSNISNSRRYLSDLCDAIRAAKMGITWSCESRIDTISRELVEKMYAAGCRAITFGMESADPRVLKNMNKGVSEKKMDQFKALVKYMRRRGMIANINVIVGFPGEDRESVRRTVDFLKTARPIAYSMSKFFLERGTAIWERRKEFGLSGEMYEWKHRTMRSGDLDRIIRNIFIEVSKDPDICHWTSASVDLVRHMAKGKTFGEFVRYLKAVNRICAEDMPRKGASYSSAYDANFRYITDYLS